MPTLSALLFFLLLLQVSQSLQAPVNGKLGQAPAEMHPAQDFAALPPLYNLIKSRPRNELHEATEQHQVEFATHPDVKKIKLDEKPIKVAEQFQALRGNVVDASWNRKMTTSIRRHLERKKASPSLIETAELHNYAERRNGTLERDKRRREAMPLDKAIESKRRKARMRTERTAKAKEERARGVEKVLLSSEPFSVSMDRLIGNRRPTAMQIQEEAVIFRDTHFTNEHSFTFALRSYLLEKGFTSKEAMIAVAKRRKLRDKQHMITSWRKKKKLLQGEDKNTTSSSTKATKSSMDVPSSSNATKDNKDTVDKFTDTNWWDSAF